MRDERVAVELDKEGWTVIRLPEHDLRTKASLADTAERVAPLLSQSAKPHPPAAETLC